MNNKEDIMRFLDEVLTKIEAGDHKKAKAMKEKAKKDSEKRIKVGSENGPIKEHSLMSFFTGFPKTTVEK